MNIKGKEAHRLALELAAATGESVTAAVTTAVRERLDKVRRARKAKRLSQDLLAIGHACAQLLQGPPIDHAELLYDERGLPK